VKTLPIHILIVPKFSEIFKHNERYTYAMTIVSRLTGQKLMGPIKGGFHAVLYAAYRDFSSCPGVLLQLKHEINDGRAKPFFKRDEIDQLFQEDVLKKYAEGRYSHSAPGTIADWNDLCNNIAAPAINNLVYLRSGRVTIDERREITRDIQVPFRRLKIIEDWFIYHPENLDKLFPNS